MTKTKLPSSSHSVDITAHCPAHRARGVSWPDTLSGLSAVASCPNNPELVEARWECLEGGVWRQAWPDLSRCKSNWVKTVQRAAAAKSHSIERYKHRAENTLSSLKSLVDLDWRVFYAHI